MLISQIPRKRVGELLLRVFEILLEERNGLPFSTVLKRLEQTLPLTDLERNVDPSKSPSRCFEVATLIGAVAPIKAGWLIDYKGCWSVTEKGREAYSEFHDPEAFLIAAGRYSLRGWLSLHFPRLYSLAGSALYKVKIEYRLIRRVGLFPLIRQAIKAMPRWQEILPLQTPQRLIIPDLSFTGPDDLLRYIASIPAPSSQGAHTVYLPPSFVRQSSFRTLLERYPPDAGLKIVKSPGGVHNSRYYHDSLKRISVLHKRLIHDHRHLSLVANLLFSKGVGPRLYDLVELQFGAHICTAYVVRHVDGRVPSRTECEAGVKNIRDLENQGLIKATIPGGFEDEEFECPSCANNAFMDRNGRFNYVDFQNFLLTNYESFLRSTAVQAREASHFGDRTILRGGRYLYQSVPGVNLPGKRDIAVRAAVIRRLMETAGVSVKDRLVLDVGCNIGMMIAQYLKLEAKWGHGWDREQIIPHTERLLLALGCTRFSTSSGEISQSHRIEEDLPDFLRGSLNGCVISYLSVHAYLGWLDSLAHIPWGFLIYEGHQLETREDFDKYIQQLKNVVNFNVTAFGTYQDGDSDERILAILVRET